MIFVAVTNPYMVAAVIPVLFLIALAVRYYTPHAVALKRAESAKRSPIFSLLTNTINGLAVIRCHRGKQAFIDKMHQLLNDHGRAYLLHAGANRWFATVVYAITNAFLAVVVFVSLHLRDQVAIGVIALSIIYALFVTLLTNFITMKVLLPVFLLKARVLPLFL
jgi:ATP-binding cassette subfamily C (CFTR/MRP) protein 4